VKLLGQKMFSNICLETLENLEQFFSSDEEQPHDAPQEPHDAPDEQEQEPHDAPDEQEQEPHDAPDEQEQEPHDALGGSCLTELVRIVVGIDLDKRNLLLPREFSDLPTILYEDSSSFEVAKTISIASCNETSNTQRY